jgi:nuclear pore complex protein Nup153
VINFIDSYSVPEIHPFIFPYSFFNNLENQVQMSSPSSTGSPMFRFSSPIVKSTEADILPPSSVSSKHGTFHPY